MLNNSTFFVGLDLGDKFSYITMIDQEGELIEESRLPTTKASFQRKFSTLQPCRVAMEVGTHSRWASQLLKELGHDVLVANARKLRAIYHNPRKGDRADAATLARLARLDPELLSPIHHRSPEAQADLAVLRSRDAIVRCRTLLINHARDIVTLAPALQVQVKPPDRACPPAPPTASLAKLPPTSPRPCDLLWTLSSRPSLPSPSRSNPMTRRTKSFAANATRRPGCSVRSAVWARSLPWPSFSHLKTLIASTAAGRSVLPLGSSPGGINPAIKIPSCESRKRGTPTCAVCSSDPPNTSWGPLVRTATCAAGV